MGFDILSTLLGFPVGILANLAWDKIKVFIEKIDPIPLQGLFTDAFYTALDQQPKEFHKWVRELENSIKADEGKFIEIFNINVENYDSFISKLKTGKFQETAARNIVNQFNASNWICISKSRQL